MFNRLKLLQKQFAVVGTILVLELILMATLQILLLRAEAENQRATRAYEVSAQAAQLVKECTDTATMLILYGLSKNDEYRRRSMMLSEDIPRKIKSLDQTSLEFKEDREGMQKVEATAELWNTLLTRARKLIEQPEVPGFTANVTSFFGREIQPHMRDLSNQLVSFLDNHKKVEAVQAQRLAKSKMLLEWILIAGGIMQILLAIGSIVFFTRSITGRIGVLTENTLRLGRGLPLNKPSNGADEIAQLDTVFHEMAQALVAASDKEKAIVDGMPVGFMTINNNGAIMSVNPRILAMVHASSDQLIGTPFADLVTSKTDGAKLSFQVIKDAALGHFAEFLFLRFDKTSFPAELMINSLQGLGQELLICNVLDVTERHEIERLKGEFVSIVSHDLRSPLGAIQGILQLLEAGILGQLNERGQELVAGSQQEAQRLLSMVSDLLDIARMEAGRIELDPAPVMSKTLVSRSINAVSSLAAAKEIKVVSDDLEFELVADAERIVQLLVNFLSNAIKYSPAQSTIEIECLKKDEIAEFRVIDHGPGVPKEAQTKIFERFEQVSKEDRTQKGGTGLGLAICKLIVQAHGGTTGVDSEVDQGSCFWFKIPLNPG